MLEKIILFIGIIVLSILLLILSLELIFRIKDKISNYLYPDRYLEDYHQNYRKYVKYYASWDDSMFDYSQTVGLRLFNKNSKHYKTFAEINQHGFRTHEFKEKKKDDFIIIFSGGSAAFGSGATSNSKTVAGIIENRLNKISKKNVVVYNLAQINNFQTQEIITLLFLYNKLKPDCIISLNGWNELTANNIMTDNTLNEFNIFNITELNDFKPLGVKKNLFQNFLKHSYVFFENYLSFIKYFDFLKPKSFSKRDRDKKSYRNFKDSIDVGSKLYLKNMDIFQKLSKSFNFKYYAFLQPYITQKKDLSPEENKFIEFRKNESPLSYDEDIIAALYSKNNIYSKIEDTFNSSSNAKLINLFELFKNNKYNIFYSMVHLSDLGQEIVAEKIVQEIKKDLVEDEINL